MKRPTRNPANTRTIRPVLHKAWNAPPAENGKVKHFSPAEIKEYLESENRENED